jgi:hypothetical protein
MSPQQRQGRLIGRASHPLRFRCTNSGTDQTQLGQPRQAHKISSPTRSSGKEWASVKWVMWELRSKTSIHTRTSSSQTHSHISSSAMAQTRTRWVKSSGKTNSTPTSPKFPNRQQDSRAAHTPFHQQLSQPQQAHDHEREPTISSSAILHRIRAWVPPPQPRQRPVAGVEARQMTARAQTAAQSEAAVVADPRHEACHHLEAGQIPRGQETQLLEARPSPTARLVLSSSRTSSSNSSSLEPRRGPTRCLMDRVDRRGQAPRVSSNSLDSNISSNREVPSHTVRRGALEQDSSQREALQVARVAHTSTLVAEEVIRIQVTEQVPAAVVHPAHQAHLEEVEEGDPQALQTTEMRTDLVGETGIHAGQGTADTSRAPIQLTSLVQVTVSSSSRERSSSHRCTCRVERQFPQGCSRVSTGTFSGS